MDETTQGTRVAIELLTLWMEDDRDAEHIADVMLGLDEDGRFFVMAGLLNLGMFLAVDLARARGATDLRLAMAEYLRGISLLLPE